MADILCPVCAKPSPADAETCWNCGARLKPGSPSDPAASGEPDWLNGLRSQSEESSPPAGPGPEDEGQPEAEPGDTPDWLARIRQRNQEEQAGEDWLGEFGSEESPSAEGGPEWMVAGEEDNRPEWMKDFPAESEQAGAQADESLSWLGSLQNNGETQPAGEGDDWLSLLRTDEPGQDSSPVGPEDAVPPAASSSDQPDWMKDLATWHDQGETPGSESSPEPASPGGEEEWITPFAAVPEPLSPAPSEDTPDWLKQFAAEDSPAGDAAPEVPPDAAPDWMNQFTDQPAPAAPEPGADLSAWLADLPAGEEQAPQTGKMPAWLEDLTGGENAGAGLEDQPAVSEQGEGAEPPQPGMGGQLPEPMAEEETPEWLKNFAAEQDFEGEAGEEEALEAGVVQPFSGADLTDWFDAVDAGQEPRLPAEMTSGEADELLEKAQLPNWLQAMRPVELVVPALKPSALHEDEGSVEKYGPLAGLIGTLPGEDLVTQVSKPPAYSSRLQASERQRNHAALIDEMLLDEARPLPPRAERSHVPQRLTRLVIALVLIAVLLVPIVTRTHLMAQPTLFPQETVSFRDLVQGLPENTPVLLAVDYEPGLSGELQLAAVPVIEQLAARKAQLAVMSTVPTGPVLAANLFAAAAQPNTLMLTNLGYLAGGTAGLQQFARLPQMALPYTLAGQPAWTQGALEGMTSLQEFGALVVLTDNAETARAWIEQVQPALDKTPLLMVVSAQVAPLVQPYLDSGQVQGMVSGLAGGTMFAQISQPSGSTQAYWDSYQFGLFTVILLILVGGVVQAVGSLMKRSPARKKA